MNEVVESTKLDNIMKKQATLENKLDFIFEILQDIRDGLEKQESDKSMINAKNRKKDAEKEIKNIEMDMCRRYDRRREETQRYNSYIYM